MHFTKKLIVASAAAIAVGGMISLPAHAAEKVNYLLPAPGFLPAFAPWQLAKYKGFYASEGLEVTFAAYVDPNSTSWCRVVTQQPIMCTTIKLTNVKQFAWKEKESSV